MTDRELAIQLAEDCDEREHSKIIGSKIIGFYFEPIPDRKTMHHLIINTDTTFLRIRCKLGKLGNVVDSPFLKSSTRARDKTYYHNSGPPHRTVARTPRISTKQHAKQK